MTNCKGKLGFLRKESDGSNASLVNKFHSSSVALAHSQFDREKERESASLDCLDIIYT